VRGTFANVRLKNLLVPGVEGGITRHLPDGEQTSIYDAAMRYQQEGTPLMIIGGKEYGSGSSRDWAAKGTKLLGVKAVLAESFERIHRSNLVGMGVLPLQFLPGQNAESLGLTGRETYDVTGLASGLSQHQRVKLRVRDESGNERTLEVISRLDGPVELEYFRQGGILPAVIRRLAN
jgi:aconitate hydratase